MKNFRKPQRLVKGQRQRECWPPYLHVAAEKPEKYLGYKTPGHQEHGISTPYRDPLTQGNRERKMSLHSIW